MYNAGSRKIARPLTGIVLAGGASRRMGRDKAMLPVGEETLLTRTLLVLGQVAREVLVIGRAASGIQGVRAIEDRLPGSGPLGGLLTGLDAASYPTVIAMAVDHPSLDGHTLASLVDLLNGYDAVVPRIGGHLHPTHAVYARSVAPVAREFVDRGVLALSTFVARLNTRFVADTEWEALGMDPNSLVNVNTPEAWQHWTSLPDL